jgi:mono/diheme cytochrome c family protein
MSAVLVALIAIVAAPKHFANADDVATVTEGKAVYTRWCASCHGRRLQGQPLWQLEDEFTGRRAPAHDQTGHTWAHSDDELFAMVRQGLPYMPAFGSRVTDRQITASIAYIKATWPVGLRIAQALLNPAHAGMPANAAAADWTLPPTCSISAQRWRTTSR